MKRNFYSFIIAAMASSALVSCGDNNKIIAAEQTQPTGSNAVRATTTDSIVTIDADTTFSVTINGATQYQTIDGFAASDAWSMNYVGKYWSKTTRGQIAELLFSQRIVNGQPDGIGLSSWRVNVGGGTADNDGNDAIEMPERKVECFLTADGTYNWNKQAGQQYFMQQAKEYGVNDFVLFSNTPPVYFTKNGKGYSESGAYANLKSDCYDDFADFLATTAEHFVSEGYNISYISPVNEPQYNWTDGQEGSGWQNSEVAKLVRNLDSCMTAKGLNDTKILVGEAAAWNYLYETDATAGSGRSNVINDLFGKTSANYIGNLEHVPAVACAHSYWLDTSWSTLRSARVKAKMSADLRGLKLYQTEWCLMSDGYEDITSYDDASYMDLALIMAKVIHADLTVANVCSWSYWTTCERERWSQKNRFWLIRLIPSGGDYGDLTSNGSHVAGKNLWVLGNYSLFIRPGYKRIKADAPTADNKFLTSAYISEDNSKLVAVYTNLMDMSVKVTNTITVDGKKASNPIEYVTSESSDLKKVADDETTVIPARSVATIVYELEDDAETSGIKNVYAD